MIVDANILLYAADSGSRFHAPAAAWLGEGLNGPARVGLPWLSLTAFVRIVTHPRAASSPLSPEEAWAIVDGWLAADAAWIPVAGARHAELFRRPVIDGDLRGNLVPDAHLAALAIEHGVGVCSADSDFARFPGLGWVNPLTGGTAPG